MIPKLSDFRKADAGQLFRLVMRFYFGVWLLYVGGSKWIPAGPGGFIGYLGSDGQFGASWVPAVLVTVLGWIIVAAEPLLALWLLSGKHERLAWLLTSKLMFMLMFGQTILQQYPAVANNWQYVALALACAALSPKCQK